MAVIFYPPELSVSSFHQQRPFILADCHFMQLGSYFIHLCRIYLKMFNNSNICAEYNSDYIIHIVYWHG